MLYRFADRLRTGSGRNCPKHVEFYSKNKFEKLVHVVGFVIRISHDERSPELQNVSLLIKTKTIVELPWSTILRQRAVFRLMKN